MRIRLDECIDGTLRHHFTGHLCHTCRYAGFSGLSKGQLLTAAEQAGFEVLITVNQKIPHRQSLRGRKICLMIVQARTTNLDDLADLIPNMLAALVDSRPGEVLRIGQ